MIFSCFFTVCCVVFQYVCSVLLCSAACCSVLQCVCSIHVAVCCSVFAASMLQCVAVCLQHPCCSVLQCVCSIHVAVCCSVFAAFCSESPHHTYAVFFYCNNTLCCSVVQRSQCNILQTHIYTYMLRCVCSMLHCDRLPQVAVCCSVLQCVAVCCSVLQCVTVCCSMLQYVAL